MELQLLVSFSLLIHSVFSDQCRRYDSDTLKEGQYLPDSSFKQLKDSSLYSCAAACYSHSICRSFNVNKRTRTCFLNVADRTCPGRSLTSNTDFVYSTITGWHKGIAGQCERNLCMRDQQCHIARNRSLLCDTVWLGASDRKTEGVWVWIDGQELGYKDWVKTPTQQPNDWSGAGAEGEDCLGRRNFNGDGWFDFGCAVNFTFICEYAIP